MTTAVLDGAGPLRERGGTVAPRGRVRRHLGTVVLVLSLLVLGAAVAVPHLSVRLLVVESGSMTPTMPKGSLLLEHQVPATDLRPGMVTTFWTPVADTRLETHRLVRVDRRDGRTFITTRGDANPGNDPWEAELLGDRAWVVTGTVPAVGHVADAVRNPVVLAGLAWLLPLVFLVSTFRLIWRRPTTRTAPAARTGRHRARRTPRRLGRRGLRALVVLGVSGAVFLALGLSGVAHAAFTATAARGHSASTAVLRPPTVADLQAICSLGGATMQVSWTPVSTGETTYRIDRKTATTGYTTLATVPASTQTYQDRTVVVLVQYTYRVTAVRGTWTSAAATTNTTGFARACN